jgi:hypothetical protein
MLFYVINLNDINLFTIFVLFCDAEFIFVDGIYSTNFLKDIFYQVEGCYFSKKNEEKIESLF